MVKLIVKFSPAVDGVLVVDVGGVLIILSMDNHCIYRLYRNMSECDISKTGILNKA